MRAPEVYSPCGSVTGWPRPIGGRGCTSNTGSDLWPLLLDSLDPNDGALRPSGSGRSSPSGCPPRQATALRVSSRSGGRRTRPSMKTTTCSTPTGASPSRPPSGRPCLPRAQPGDGATPPPVDEHEALPGSGRASRLLPGQHLAGQQAVHTGRIRRADRRRPPLDFWGGTDPVRRIRSTGHWLSGDGGQSVPPVTAAVGAEALAAARVGDREHRDQQPERLAAFVERRETGDVSQLLVDPAS